MKCMAHVAFVLREPVFLLAKLYGAPTSKTDGYHFLGNCSSLFIWHLWGSFEVETIPV